MRLSDLLAALPDRLRPLGPIPADDPVIRGIAYDSRAVAPGDLFFALRGAETDGHLHLTEAIRLGAAALVVEETSAETDGARCPTVRVADTRRALAPVSARFFGNPAGELTLIGVTGTNGKTSTTYLVESILARAGRRTGLIGTIEVRYAGVRERATNTTPESFDLQRTLRAMCTRHVEAVAMEVSSHGLELGRVDGCLFDVAAMTNLSQDHLDFHGSMDAYFEAKALLFRRYLSDGAAAVINVDDPAGTRLVAIAEKAGARVVRVTRDAGADAEVALEGADARIDGTTARVRMPAGSTAVSLPLVGDFNLENLLVACGIAAALDIPAGVVAEGAAACPQVPGRVERIGSAKAEGPTVFVDYAHTPDAVEKLLHAVRALVSGRLVTVFGCGGDRDRTKRPLMAAAVARWSDLAIATSDNPRREDPHRILEDVVTGLGGMERVEPDALAGARKAYAVEVDRRRAISLAIRAATPEDTVVIAGKGHEDYQIIGRDRLPFSDPDEAARALAARGAA